MVHHGGNIEVPKQWNSSPVSVPSQSGGSWSLFFCKPFLLFQKIWVQPVGVGHASEKALYYTLLSLFFFSLIVVVCLFSLFFLYTVNVFKKKLLKIIKLDTFFASNGPRKKSEPQIGFEPTTLCELVGCSNLWANGTPWRTRVKRGPLTRTASRGHIDKPGQAKILKMELILWLEGT